MQVHQNVANCRDDEIVSNINTCFETGVTLVLILKVHCSFYASTQGHYTYILFIFVETIIYPYNQQLPMAVAND